MDSKERDKIIAKQAENALNTQRENTKVDFVIYEACNARWQKITGRIIFAWVLTIILAMVLIYVQDHSWRKLFAEYDISSYEVDMDSGETGDALYNYIGEDGDIYNGTYQDKAKNVDKTERLEGEINEN